MAKIKREHIKKAKQLFTILFPTSKRLYRTAWGNKNITGMINTILNIMYGYRI